MPRSSVTGTRTRWSTAYLQGQFLLTKVAFLEFISGGGFSLFLQLFPWRTIFRSIHNGYKKLLSRVPCTIQRILYELNHKGSPRKLEWVAHSFSSGSSHPRNGISCTEVAVQHWRGERRLCGTARSWEKIPHIQGQEWWPRGDTPRPRSEEAAVRRYPMSKVKRNPSKTVGAERGHQRADRLKLQSQKTRDHSLV